MKNKHAILINEELCVRCGLCQKDCTVNAIVVTDHGAQVTRPDCIKCGHCVAVCPKAAVSMSGFEDAPEEINKEMRVDPDLLLGQLKARRSMRHFTSEEVSVEMVSQIIEAGRYTPSGENRQTVSYVVLRENKDEYEQMALMLFRRIKRIVDIFTNKFKGFHIDEHFLFKQAPVVIVIKSTDVVDGALAASSMELMAQSLGLGVLYSGFFAKLSQVSGKLKKKLSVGSGEQVVAALVLGHPAVEYQRTAPKERPEVTYD